jgi:filamentous hemagglutinin family protein
MRNLINLIGLRRALLGGVAAATLLGAPAQALPVYAGTAQTNAGGQTPAVTSSGSTVSVDLRANRTILDWTSFNLQAGESANFYFDQRNWIALNRVTGSQININGAVNGFQAAGVGAGPTGGNVWFYSPQGIAFGPNARVNVAGLLATSSAVNTAAFLTVNGQNIPFTGSGSGGPITVAAGAQLNSSHHVALIAPQVTTAAGSTFTSGDSGSVLYGAADTFEVQLFPANLDWTIFTFIVPGRAAGTPVPQALNIAGQTTSGTIYLAAYSRAAVVGQLINAPGLLTARSSIAAYGQVTITTGRNIILGQPGPGDNAPVANLNPGLTIGHATFGEINADGNVNVILTPTNYDQGPQGNITGTKIRAGQGLVIGGSIVSIPGGVSAGDAGVNARGASIVAGQQLTIPTITVAGDLFFGSRAASSTFDTATSGGNLTVMNLQTVSGNRLSSGGTMTINSGAGPINVANVSAGGAMSINTGGAINITNLTGTTIDLGSTGAQTIGSAVGSGSLTFRSGGLANIGSLTTPALTINAGSVRLGTASVGGEAVLRTVNLDLLTSFTAGDLTIESIPGSFILGGTAEPGLTDAEFQRIRVTGAVNLYAGLRVPIAGIPNPSFGDFEVRTLTIDPTRVPTLNLYANSAREVRVVGPVDTVGNGAGMIRIGAPEVGSAWAPKTIKLMDPSDPVDFAAGVPADVLANTRRFEFYATGDILIGSQRFVELVSSTSEPIDLSRGLPAGVAPTPDEVGRLYLVGASLKMAAGGRILTQNTSPAGSEVSIVLTGAGVPASEPLLSIGRAQNAQVFVSLASPTGLQSGSSVALSNRIARFDSDSSSASSSGIFVNGCALGVGCALSTPASQFRIEAFSAPTPVTAAIDPPVLSPLPPAVDGDERETEAVTTGAGNEEIWRRADQ